MKLEKFKQEVDELYNDYGGEIEVLIRDYERDSKVAYIGKNEILDSEPNDITEYILISP